MAPEKTDSQKRGACFKMRPSFCVDRANRSVDYGRMVCKVACVWGRFRLGLTLDHAVLCDL